MSITLNIQKNRKLSRNTKNDEYEITVTRDPTSRDKEIDMVKEMRNSLMSKEDRSPKHKNSCKSQILNRNKSELIGSSSMKLIERNMHNHQMFTTIAKENKFKSYIKNKDEVSKVNNGKSHSLLSKNSLSKIKNLKHSHHQKDSALANLISISNLSTRFTQNSTLFLDHSKGEFGTFLTSNPDILHTKTSKEEREEIKRSRLIKTIFSNVKEANLFNSVNFIASTYTGKQEGNRTVKNQVPTLDPDFFLKHNEKNIEKNKLLNFNSNPSLYKIGSSCNIHKSKRSLGPDYFSEEEKKNLLNMKIIKEGRNIHDSNKQQNFLNYKHSFNKFGGNSEKIQTDFKDLIYNTKTDNFHKSLSTIKDVIKGEMLSRSINRKGPINMFNKSHSNFYSKLYEKEKRNPVGVEETLKEIKENKEKILSNYRDEAKLFFSSLEDFMNLKLEEKDSNMKNNSNNVHVQANTNAYLDEEEKNVLGYNTNSSFYRKSMSNLHERSSKLFKPYNSSSNIFTTKKIIQHKLDQTSFGQERTLTLSINPKKFKKKLTIPVRSDSRVFQKKIPAEDVYLSRRMNFQDQRITFALRGIAPKEIVEKALKGGEKLQINNLQG